MSGFFGPGSVGGFFHPQASGVRTANDSFNLTTGPQGTQFVRSFGFTPKFALVRMNGTIRTTSGSGRSSMKQSWGFASSTQQIAWGGFSNDTADNGTNGTFLKSGRVLCEQADASNLAGELTVAFSGNDLTFEVASTATFSTTYRVNVWVLGGESIESVFVGKFTAATSGTTTVSTVGFQGNAGLFGSVFADADPFLSADMGVGIGWAIGTGASNSVVSCVRSRFNQPNMNTFRYQRTGEPVVLSTEAAGSMGERHTFTGFTSNGFTLAKQEGAQAGLIVPVAVIKGGSWSLMTANGVNNTSSDITFSGASAQPRGGLVQTVGRAESTLDTNNTECILSTGSFDESLNQQCMSAIDRHNVAAAVIATHFSSTDIATWLDNASTTGAVDGAFALQSVNSSGAVGRMTDASENLAHMAMLAVS